ncbi:MAG: hypothetical protein A4E56_00389 [Pelotomaculum sp. PtaU1.Bin065]|nr:MAG: hypothetical protein A4E56_00389 [Pelotomaculum sp. PtaU1.Bin065]
MRQSIWYSCTQRTESNFTDELKNGNRRENNNTVLLVAKIIINEFNISRSRMASIVGISEQKISSAIKKLRSKVSNGHIIIGLNSEENEKLITSLEMRERVKRYVEDNLLRKVAGILINDYMQSLNQIAENLCEKPLNISRAYKKIKDKLDAESLICGLSEQENKKLRQNVAERERKIQNEKERRQQEKEVAAANREAMKDICFINKRKAFKRHTSISPAKLARWNWAYYQRDENGNYYYNGEGGCRPSDLPNKYPIPKILVGVYGVATGVEAENFASEKYR